MVSSSNAAFLSQEYDVKTQVPVPVSSMDSLVRSLPKNLQSAYLELQSKEKSRNSAATIPPQQPLPETTTATKSSKDGKVY
jgi:hypothetical protein